MNNPQVSSDQSATELADCLLRIYIENLHTNMGKVPSEARLCPELAIAARKALTNAGVLMRELPGSI